MRVMSFLAGSRESFGIVRDDGIVDARRHLNDRHGSLRDLLIDGGLDELRPLAEAPVDYAPDTVSYLPVVNDPACKILCVGVNYLPHIREMGRERPDYPVIFTRFPNTFVGHGAALVKPRVSEQFDFEGELAVIIGRRARHVPRSEAQDCIAGYCCLNDGSVRDFQRHGLQWTPGKNFARSGSIGPWMVTADEIPDPAALTLTTTLNGQVVQNESIGELCFDIPALIEYITSWAELEPGDIIATGTPGGVGAGRKPPLWMRPGDTVEVAIPPLGTLSNTIVAEDAA